MMRDALRSWSFVAVYAITLMTGIALGALLQRAPIDQIRDAEERAAAEVLAYQLVYSEAGCPVIVPPGSFRFSDEWIETSTGLLIPDDGGPRREIIGMRVVLIGAPRAAITVQGSKETSR